MNHVSNCNPLIAWPVSPERATVSDDDLTFEVMHDLFYEFWAGATAGLLLGLAFDQTLFFLL
jgi:hypothetical protein